jgi:hypothetical protein
MGRKTKNQLETAIRAHNLNYPAHCPFCNCRVMLNNTHHVHSKKHVACRELFLKDHPDFKESVYNYRLVNLKKLLGTINYQDNDLSKFIDFILREEPSSYDIEDVVDDAKK